MSLDSNREALTLLSKYTGLKSTGGDTNPQNHLDFVASVIDAGFQMAVKTLSNIDITPPAGSLVFPFDSVIRNPYMIGEQCSEYWCKTITTSGAPDTLDGIVSVTNDASKIAIPIANNLLALTGRKGTESKPLYFEFVDAIYKEVRTIKWTVTEIKYSDGSTTVLTNTVT